MNVVGLFSGIGGIEYGFHLAGLETTLMCEINDSAQAVLRAHFDAPIVSDVSDIPSLPAGTQVLAGGFPCTDLSQAGRTAGIDGEKSGLVRHMFRLIDTADDALRYVVIENVPNMLKLDGGKAMDFLTRSFEERGYQWAYRTVDTRWWGLPQRRLRVVMVASKFCPWHVLFDYEEPDAPEAFCREVGTSLYGFYSTEGSSGIGWCQDALPPIKAQPHGPSYWDRRDGTFWLPAIEDCERLQGFEAGWTSAVSQVTRRFRMVGNAVSVPVAKWIGSRLLLDRARIGSRPLAAHARIGRAGFPADAYFDGEDRYMMAKSSPWSTTPMKRLRSFLKHESKPLSHRAATGFRKRLRAGTLAPRQDFVDALDAYIERVQP